MSLPTLLSHRPLRLSLLAVWTFSALVGAWRGFELLSMTRVDFRPPRGSLAERERDVFVEDFPAIALETAVTTVLIESLSGDDVVAMESVRRFDERFREEMQTRIDATKRANTSIITTPLIYVSYFTLAMHDGMPNVARRKFVSRDGRATIAKVAMKSKEKMMSSAQFANDVDEVIKSLKKEEESFNSEEIIRVSVGGLPTFSRDLRVSSERDLRVIDASTFPIALLVLLSIVRSERLILLPIVSIFVVITTSFLLVRWIAESREVVNITPSIMVSCAIAFSVDYSLFILSRFREEVVMRRLRLGLGLDSTFNGAVVLESLAVSLRASGHSVLASGTTLSLCWLVLMTFPVSTIASVGLGCGLTVAVCILVNLTLTPALILTFPEFFSRFRPMFQNPNWGVMRILVPRLVRRFLRRSWRWLRRLLTVPLLCVFHWILEMRRRSTTTTTVVEGIAEEEEETRWSGNNPNEPSNPVIEEEDDDDTSSSPRESERRLMTTHNEAAEDEAIVEDAQRAMDHEERLSSPPEVFENYAQIKKEMARFEMISPRIFGLATFVTKSKLHACLIVVFSIFLVMPFSRIGWEFEHSASLKLTIPRSSEGYKAYERLEKTFGNSEVQPVYVIVSTREEREVDAVQDLKEGRRSAKETHEPPAKRLRVLSPEFFEKVQRELIVALLLNTTVNVEGIVWVDGEPISFSQLETCVIDSFLLSLFSPDGKHRLSPRCELLMFLLKTQFNPDKNAILLSVKLESAADGVKGGKWIRRTREALKSAGFLCDSEDETSENINVHLVGEAITSFDTVDAIYSAFPTSVLITSMTVFCIISLTFKSLIVPLRSLLTIGMTLGFVYGAADLVFQRGCLKPLGFHGLQSETNEIHWVAPVLLFSVLVGLALDFDVFLLTRIFEFKTKRFSDVDAVRAGLSSNFSVVTAAGTIMLIAFGGLLFSDTTVTNQISFFLISGVFFDTFFVRIFVVPALMALLGRYNFYPRKMALGLHFSENIVESTI